MNIILNAGQSDTRIGDLTLPGAANLTGLENTLVENQQQQWRGELRPTSGRNGPGELHPDVR